MTRPLRGRLCFASSSKVLLSACKSPVSVHHQRTIFPHSGHSERLFLNLVSGTAPLLASRLRESVCNKLHKEPSNQVIKVWLQVEIPAAGTFGFNRDKNVGFLSCDAFSMASLIKVDQN